MIMMGDYPQNSVFYAIGLSQPSQTEEAYSRMEMEKRRIYICGSKWIKKIPTFVPLKKKR
jgi:hypothetical protein